MGPLGARVFTDSAPVLEVELAARSGIGWRGKHTLALQREGGSMFFLGEIFVDLALAADAAGGGPLRPLHGLHRRVPDAGHRRALPAGRAALHLLPDDRARRGHRAEALRPLLGNRIYGCDDCQLVCPWNKYARVSRLPDFDARAPLDGATLLQLWAWDEAEFLRRTEGSAIRRIGHARWQRNLAVALGNALRSCARCRDRSGAARSAWPSAGELLAEHIDWALRQLSEPTAASTASHSGRLSAHSSVDTVTRPATKEPWPPMRTAST